MVKSGDKVRFLNDKGGGTVSNFIDKKTVNVEIDGGFEIPYPISQLVVVDRKGKENYSETENESRNTNETKIKHIKPEVKLYIGKDKPDFFFYFVPENSINPTSTGIKLHLVNDSNFSLLFHFSTVSESGYMTKKFGLINPNSKKLLSRIEGNDISNMPVFGFQILWFSTEGQFLGEPVTKKFKINPLKLYKEISFQTNRFFDKKALIYQITKSLQETELDKMTEDDFRKLVKGKEKVENETITLKPKPPEIIEIDLHINELVENSAGLSNGDILEIQLKKVESEMKLAIQNGTRRLVFIHGVGQGVLKQEVAKLLNNKFSKYYFQDASFREYGFGATMVILKRI